MATRRPLVVVNGVTSELPSGDTTPTNSVAPGTARQLLQTNAGGTATEWTSNVDVPGTLDVTSTATFDSIAQYPAGSAGAPTITFTGDTNTGIYSPGADQVAISTNGTGRLFVDASGNVQIAGADKQINPGGRLLIATSVTNAGTTLRAIPNGTSSAAALQVGNSTDVANQSIGSLTVNSVQVALNSAVNGTGTQLPLVFNVGTECARITTDGRLGLGTSTPQALLDVNTKSSAGNLNVINASTENLTGAGSQAIYIGAYTGTSYGCKIKSIYNYASALATSLAFETTNTSGTLTEAIRIDSSQRVGIGTTPDSRLHVLDGSGNGLRIGYNPGSNNFNIYDAAQHLFRNNGGASEYGRFDSSGRLLVGTSSSVGDYQLQLQQNTGSAPFTGSILLRRGIANASILADYDLGVIGAGSATNVGGSISFQSDAAWGSGDYPTRIVFSTTADGASSPTERVRISQDGRTWINTTSQIFAGFGLHVVYSGGACAFKETSGTAANNLQVNWHTATSSDNRFIEFGTEASYTLRGSITYNRGGGVTAYNTTSDYRAKTLLGNVENTGQTIDALKVYRGVMNGATIERPMLVAHEAQEVAPYCVTGEKDAVDDDGNPIYQQMDHQVLVPLLIAEIQQLRARVAALEAQ